MGNILFDSISWEDAMTIHIGKIKNDQEGAKAFARHVNVNPKDPVVCPVLAMSILVFTKGYDRSASSSSTGYIFGESGKDSITNWLSKILIQCKDAILALGLIFTQLGS